MADAANVEMWRRRAHQTMSEGKLFEAIEAHRQLLALRPDLADSWFNLAYLERAAHRFREALDAYQKALDLGISRPEEVHVNRAVILSEYLEQPDEAEAELQLALRANPGFIVAWLNLGNLCEDRGDSDAAIAAYRQALFVDPGNARALARLAGLTRTGRPDDPVILALEKALMEPALLPDDRAELGFALGHALDAAGRYDEAFAAFATANAQSRASAPPPGVNYDREAHEALIDRIIAIFSEPAPVCGTDTEQSPIFICGMFRSGSTLVEQILASHSQIKGGGELELIPAIVARELQPYPEAVAQLDFAAVERLRRIYLDSLNSIFPGAAHVTDKRPDNFLHVGLIKLLFPSAKIVHTRRNPIDNILSIYFLHFQHSIEYGLALDDIAHWYQQYRRLMDHWTRLYGADILDVEYDRLVREPEPIIAEILEFCGLQWEEACLAFHENRGVVKTASVWQVRKPLYQASSGRWRNYRAHLGDLPAIFER